MGSCYKGLNKQQQVDLKMEMLKSIDDLKQGLDLIEEVEENENLKRKGL